MEKINILLQKYSNLIIVVLLMLLLTKSCSNENKVLYKKVEALTVKVDSLNAISVTKKDLKIEGLRVEKRMIQSTDRKILDVNRQSEIDKEIELLLK
jgi:hypothetical protein